MYRTNCVQQSFIRQKFWSTQGFKTQWTHKNATRTVSQGTIMQCHMQETKLEWQPLITPWINSLICSSHWMKPPSLKTLSFCWSKDNCQPTYVAINFCWCTQTYEFVIKCDISYHDITFCNTAVLATLMRYNSLTNNILLSPFIGLQRRNNSRAARLSLWSAMQRTLCSHRPTSTNSSFINQKMHNICCYNFSHPYLVPTCFDVSPSSLPSIFLCLHNVSTRKAVTQDLTAGLFAWTLPTLA